MDLWIPPPFGLTSQSDPRRLTCPLLGHVGSGRVNGPDRLNMAFVGSTVPRRASTAHRGNSSSVLSRRDYRSATTATTRSAYDRPTCSRRLKRRTRPIGLGNIACWVV